MNANTTPQPTLTQASGASTGPVTVVVANRGEIARRIVRTARRLGHRTVAVATSHDDGAPHSTEADHLVRLDMADHPLGYLDGEAIIAAALVDAQVTGRTTLVHPGYGFLAENSDFAQAVIDAGLGWVGPNPKVIEQMGSKIGARGLAADAGVATIPGFSDSQDPTALAQAGADIGWPVLIKASAGGGGKGIRIARSGDDFDAALVEARTESERAFGDGDVIVERYVERPRHVEVQVIGDRHGNVIDLGTRECSVQRRYQKLLEEAPAPNLDPETRTGLRDAAVALARAVGYDSAGTVEFIVDDESGEFYFLEMNTRLQVEHPVTEAITGLDLVQMMIDSALGRPLAVAADQVTLSGHAIEARIAAEDAGDGFAPRIGTVHHVRVPDGVRWDSAIEAGSQITPHYDSMIAKLIVEGPDRPGALARLRRALDELVVGGVATTAGFHRWLVDQDPVIAGRVTTRFLDETELPFSPEPPVEVAARAWVAAARAQIPTSVWQACPDFSVTDTRPDRVVGLTDAAGQTHEVTVSTAAGGSTEPGSRSTVVDLAGRRISINVSGHTHHFEVPSRTKRWAASTTSRNASGAAIVAPFPAVVAEVYAAPGDQVDGDQVLVVIEAMKMLHSLRSTGAATIDEVRIAPGDQVATDQILVTFAE